MRKRAFVGISTLLAAAMITGCGMTSGSGSATTASSGAAQADSTSGGESDSTLDIILVGTESDAYVPGYKKIMDDFSANNEYGVTVNYQFISNSDYKTKITTLMASDSEPDIIFTWELGYLENFVNGNKIVDLQPYLDADKDWADSFNAARVRSFAALRRRHRGCAGPRRQRPR